MSSTVETKGNSIRGIDGLDKYVEHIKDRGLHSLKQMGKKIMKQINAEKKITKEVNAVSEDYIKQIQNYCDHVTETYGNRKEGYIVEDEYIFRNILETACVALYRAQWQLLKKITMKLNSTKENFDKIEHIGEIIYKQYIQDKKREMKYICSEYKLCIPYPSFTDYIENFITELLRLSDDKLKVFMNLLKDIIVANDDIQIVTYRILEKDRIIKEAQDLCGNFSLRECLSAVRAVLNQRFKIFVCPDGPLAVRIQATRILLDSMDKTFHYSHDLNLLLDYGSIINAIKTWNKDDASPLSRTFIQLFINSILSTIAMSENSLKGALIEIIVTGGSDYDGLNKIWFVTGSRGVYVNTTNSRAENTKLHSSS